jgi:predicted nucleotidyltransferase
MLTHEKICTAIKKASEQFPITKASYFGSYANGQATEESDLDLLVEFKAIPISILTTISLKHFLEDELGKAVDVVSTPLPKGAVIKIEKMVSVI